MTGVRPIRNSIKAVIIRDGSLLLTRNRDDQGDFYLLPGGGQEKGETMEEALRRECREEAGVEVRVGRLLWIREYIGAHHEFALQDGDIHQVEIMFECAITGGEPGVGPVWDLYQTGVEWVPLRELAGARLYPATLGPLLAEGKLPGNAAYLGDAN